LRDEEHTRANVTSGIEIAKARGHGILIVGDQDSALRHGQEENFEVWYVMQDRVASALEVNRRFATQDTEPDGGSKIVVRLEARFQSK
jgi:hypothetical protein